MECCGALLTTQFSYRKGLDIYDALLCMFHTLQSALETGQDSRIMQINFSAAFDRVNHQGIAYVLCSMGIGGSMMFNIDTVSIKSIIARYGGRLCE